MIKIRCIKGRIESFSEKLEELVNQGWKPVHINSFGMLSEAHFLQGPIVIFAAVLQKEE